MEPKKGITWRMDSIIIYVLQKSDSMIFDYHTEESVKYFV